MSIIRVENLNFSFNKKSQVLHAINLTVQKGAIYGFLGPNGAGKTTAIRLILGLLKPDSGQLKVFGKYLPGNEKEIYSRIGALIEAPSMYGHLSGYDNLEITRRLRDLPKNRIEEVLKIVGLKDAGRKASKNYSLGMKQRLGLAMALLSEPELLILDEPTNGLDPNGIIETRELLVELNKSKGITIFVSSHLLSEIEKMSTHIGIISNGKIVFEGDTNDLLILKSQKSILKIQTSDNERALEILRVDYSGNLVDATISFSMKDKADAAEINRRLVSSGLDVFEMRVETSDLEDIFMNVTKN